MWSSERLVHEFPGHNTTFFVHLVGVVSRHEFYLAVEGLMNYDPHDVISDQFPFDLMKESERDPILLLPGISH